MAYWNNTMDSGSSGSLRPANVVAKPASRIAAGPFDAASAKRENETSSLPDTLITGLLIVYPAFATVVAVIVGLFFSGPSVV